MKILVNTKSYEIVLCEFYIEKDLSDDVFMFGTGGRFGPSDIDDYEIFDIAEYVKPHRHLLIEGTVVSNPNYILPQEDEIDVLKLMVADLALNQGGML